MADDPLSDRERRILAAIVETHIDLREPVGSKTLAARPELQVSPATIRAVMGTLAERGLIEKPHSSAGRVPTDRGLRLYVDSLLEIERPPEEAEAAIRSHIGEATSLEGAVGEAGRVLSRLARHACVIRAPRPETARLAHIELVRLREDALLCILVADDGRVQNRLVELSPALQERLAKIRLVDEQLVRLGQQLSEKARGRTLGELSTALSQEVAEDREDALEAASEVLGQALKPEEGGLPLLVSGSGHLLEGVDEARLDGLRELYEVLEEKQQLLELLDSAADAPGMRIFIGEESGLGELANMSLITATYGKGRDIFGSVGVIGPMHMDYGRVVPLVTLTAEAVSGLLKGS